MRRPPRPGRLSAAGGLLALFLCGPAGAGEELERAREAAAGGSEARAFDIAIAGFLPPGPAKGRKAAAPDKALFLYAVELLPENSPDRAGTLAAAAGAMLEKKSEDYAWYLGLCKAMRVTGQAAGSLPNCKKALELDPTVYPVYRELGLSYAAAGNPRKAAETLEQGVEISSSDYQARYYLAKVLEKRGDPVRAAASYAKGLALAKRGAGPEADYYRALINAGLKRTAAAPVKEKPRARTAAEPAPRPGNKQLAAACLEKFHGEFLKDNLGTALSESDRCLKFAPGDPQLAAERAPLLVRLGRYEEGVKEYERAASLYGEKNASSSALCRIKAAETWLKLGRSDSALAQYRLALKADSRDMNALKGLAAALEARSDTAVAMEVYDEILKLEPGNEKARRRKEELRSGALTGAQMLEELKLRQAADGKKTAPLPEDIKLFKAIKAAELSGAVDYLKKKVTTIKGLVAERATPEGTRLMLTGDGYKVYVFHASREAVKFFEGQGIGLREIFTLRTLEGAPAFDAAGKLTPEGEELWRKSAPGVKSWLLVYEPVPASPQAEKAAKEIEEAKKNGYSEIYEPEYLWLLQKTQCPEDVMQDAPLKLLILNDGTRRRYMMCWYETGACMNAVNNKLPSYIESYRGGNTDINDSKTSTAFFGTGGVKKAHFCENGRIWAGETPK